MKTIAIPSDTHQLLKHWSVQHAAANGLPVPLTIGQVVKLLVETHPQIKSV